LSNLTVQRQPVDIQTLHAMVDDFLETLRANKAEFTAWGVTMALRTIHPDLEIPHYSGVRERVHFIMGGPVPAYGTHPTNFADYVMVEQKWPGDYATTYKSEPTLTISVAATPAIPAARPLPQLPAAVQIKWDN